MGIAPTRLPSERGVAVAEKLLDWLLAFRFQVVRVAETYSITVYVRPPAISAGFVGWKTCEQRSVEGFENCGMSVSSPRKHSRSVRTFTGLTSLPLSVASGPQDWT